MKNAREKRPHGSGRRVSADEIGPVPETFRRPLICEFCTSAVGPVRGYKTVPNLFRLNKGTLHQPECALNPTEFVQGIARGSHGLAHVTDQGILRLELPEQIDAIPPQPPMGADTDPDGPVRQRDTTTVRPYLPPAITSAAKIARFLQMHGFDPDTVERFRIKPHGRAPIPWHRFCYGPAHSSYAALYQRLRTGQTIPHPIAVHGTVQRIDRDRNGSPYATLAANVPFGDERFTIVLRSNYDTLIKPLTVGTHVLVVGDWGIFTGAAIPQLKLFAKHHWQVAYWTNDDGNGQPTEPSCPPPVTSRQRVIAETEARKRRLAKQNRATTPAAPAPDPPAPAHPEPPAVAEPTVPPTPASAQEEPTVEEPRITDPPVIEAPPAEREPPAPLPPAAPPPPPMPPNPPPTPPAAGAVARRRGLRRWFGRRT
ncbi:hypothetical protein [Streptomyces sp. NPDC127084]|uniref:hypothetical protein n=1 Tax=Streptomyces sp. NPDC127084 TaxID=3347133 RepID=UPI0036573E09